MTDVSKGPNATKEDKNPNGGLSAKGRKKFGVKKGVTSYSSASEPDKKRWVRWALRFTKTPRPLKKPNGEPTRYALMFRAWGEPVPSSAEAVRAVHAKAMTRRKQLGMGDSASVELLGCDDCPREFLSDDALLAHLEQAHVDYESVEDAELTAELVELAENVPTNPRLYARVKAEAKRKFTVYPSAYANAWLVQEYKKRGGGFKKSDAASEDELLAVEAQEEVEEALADIDDTSAEGLTKWFNERWVDISRPKKGGGYEACGRPTEGMSAADYRKAYPKCVPASRAASMSPGERRSAITRKRRNGLPQGGKPSPVSTAQEAEEDVPDTYARAFDSRQRQKLARSGKAQKDGSYPIANGADLRNAIQAYGRSKNPEATKRHIIRRARALGLQRLLPDGWDSAAHECTHEDCERAFLTAELLQDHAAAVHTLRDIEEALRHAVREQFQPKQGPDVKFDKRVYVYARDFATDWVIFERNVGEQTTLMKVGYTMDDKGKVTFAGEPEEVVRKTVYEKVGSET